MSTEVNESPPDFCALFGVAHPIVQTGMGWVSTATLTAATAATGALGILAAVTMDAREMLDAVAAVRAHTANPFGVNLRPDQPDILERVDMLIDADVSIVSFAGPPLPATVERLRAKGIKSIVTIGKPRHAVKMLEAGVDAVIAQGVEGGGHTGVVPSIVLLPAVVDAVGGRIPVLGAGGFHDGRGLAAALALGASGIAMGTRFLVTQESEVPAHIKQFYLRAGITDTHLSSNFGPQPLRILTTESHPDSVESSSLLSRLAAAPKHAAEVRRQTGQSWVDMAREGLAMRRSKGLKLTELAVAADAAVMAHHGMVAGDAELGILPGGTVTGVIDDIPTVAELVERIVRDAASAASTAARVLDGSTRPAAAVQG